MTKAPVTDVMLCGVLVLALTAGCTQMDWVRPGTDPTLASSDMEDCRRAARLQSFQFGATGTPAAPSVIVDPISRTSTVHMPSTLPTSDPVVEYEFTTSCMRKKGYDLVRIR